MINEMITHTAMVGLAIVYAMVPVGLAIILASAAFGMAYKFLYVTVWPK